MVSRIPGKGLVVLSLQEGLSVESVTRDVMVWCTISFSPPFDCEPRAPLGHPVAVLQGGVVMSSPGDCLATTHFDYSLSGCFQCCLFEWCFCDHIWSKSACESHFGEWNCLVIWQCCFNFLRYCQILPMATALFWQPVCFKFLHIHVSACWHFLSFCGWEQPF